MATRALIGYLDDDRTFTCTYNHYDGYPSGLGKVLDKFYDTDERARVVANTGYISSIDPENGVIDSKYKESPDKIRLDGEWEDALEEMAGKIDEYGGDYGYIWYEGDGDWTEIKNHGIRSMMDQIANQMSSATGLFGPVDEIKKEDNLEEDKIMEEGYEAKWAKFINEAKEMNFDIIRNYIKNELGRGDESDFGLDAYIESLQRDFTAGRADDYSDYEMDDYVEDFQNYIADKMDF
jgi:hypothetical protein